MQFVKAKLFGCARAKHLKSKLTCLFERNENLFTFGNYVTSPGTCLHYLRPLSAVILNRNYSLLRLALVSHILSV